MARQSKNHIPVHRHDELSDTGVYLRIVTPESVDHHPVEYAHRDDYYIFGVIVRGQICYDVDFITRIARAGELQFILPGQIHRFIGGEDFEGWMVIVDKSLVSENYRRVFETASINGVTVKSDNFEGSNLRSLYAIIRSHIDQSEDIVVLRHLVSAFVGLFALEFGRGNQGDMHGSDRRMEIVLGLNALLERDMQISHSPSYYAGKLNISTVYLNEVVKAVTGLSSGAYIRGEIMLRAKRLLYHTGKTVKEIAMGLGFEDNAYFTRLFTRETGVSPLRFRQKP